MKKHLMVLDGLRGTAAISIVIFHFQLVSFYWVHPDALWLRHAYLAVDFFFCLSGYVVAYAYDDRRDSMSIVDFFTVRLIRLHPMVVMGIALGVLSYVFDPFDIGLRGIPWLGIRAVPLWKLMACALAGLFMIPSWPLPNRFDSYFSLNVPSWSLMWEYLANIAFALVLWRIKKHVLMIVVVLAAIALAVSAHTEGSLSVGPAWGQMSYAMVRTAFSFSMGLLLFRCGAAIRTPFGFVSLSVLMVALFLMPFERLNWLYETVVVLVVFPLMVAIGAGAGPSNWIANVCHFTGRISYPIYAVHFALIMVFANYHWTHGFNLKTLPWVIAGLTGLVILISYGLLVLYDEPIRRKLNLSRRQLHRNPVNSAGAVFTEKET
jgi:peptidoglycan/LPS O-acetylase OafA/YrhL